MIVTTTRYTVYAVLIISSLAVAQTQQPRWIELPLAPKPAPGTGAKIDDLFFINPETGWASVRFGNPATASVYKTTDGGKTWASYEVVPGQLPSIRSIRFTDALTGFVGSLTISPLFKTTDGGVTWNPVSNLPPGPTAVCGLFSLDSQNIFGVGAYDANRTPYFIKTTNGGESWTIKNMISPTPLAGALVDIYFFTPDIGFVVGASADGDGLNNKKAVVLRTTNGGFSWNEVYKGTQIGQLCWKINFPTPTLGFISIEPFPFGAANNPKFLKTTNGGLTWTQQSFPAGNYPLEMQGIQFLSNGQRGWVGGFRDTGYETTDGGISWTSSFGSNLNRFRMFGDTLGYASGTTIYKYTTETITSVDKPAPAVPLVTNLDQNYPNPFNPQTTIEFTLNEFTHVKLTIHDALGRVVDTILDENLDQGVYRKHWDARGFPTGTYFYRLVTPHSTETKKMLLVK